ncbi:MAG: hypothetical protein LBG28_14305 [Tannerella sp.]|jgi:hypothetical protein|nr:hypothetical protein [Tannerella sp.]MDR1602820.1 hypothetical protein [Tannerella sp.]
MTKENISAEEKIELHHPSMEEIMGAPPAAGIAAGSGTVLAILLALLASSIFITVPDTIRTNAIIYGNSPVSVLTAPESGRPVFANGGFSDSAVHEGDTLLIIRKFMSDEQIPVTAATGGFFEINPVLRYRKSVYRNDTVGYVWDMEPAPVVCTVQLSGSDARKIQAGRKIRLYPEPGEFMHCIETEVKEKFDLPSGGRVQIIAVLSGTAGNTFRGTTEVSADIETGKKSLFGQLVNPFRGLQK